MGLFSHSPSYLVEQISQVYGSPFVALLNAFWRWANRQALIFLLRMTVPPGSVSSPPPESFPPL
ncbi:uncharacterized protein BP01DRAFT_354062 [Aspergillus saccharolyticus JOP 1030-1]|uniref:Uncharacterized protein n=1 Tax=Aspergillus saccharolyticus JOP 1030-1 TaxID=1450539 RepID=A0A318ZNI9_9EURO|nr:hypothetical protein BP01DRAFT_354062 [Aspergillus saccharolyticus JOP 1030-1]PYH48215.1 hypothetical protein BP01DRAFT_354062 [Aspergillus saccharolyticus JOP 1030-1]